MCYSDRMSEVISQRQLRNDSGRIMKAIAHGHTFVVTSHSEPVAELRPLRRRRLVPAAQVVQAFAGAPAIQSEAFFHDIDTAIDQDIQPRA